MNQLTTTTSAPPVPTKPLSRAAVVAKALRDIRAELLKPWNDHLRMMAAHPKWSETVFRSSVPRDRDHRDPIVLRRPPLCEPVRRSHLDDMRGALSRVPPIDDISNITSALNGGTLAEPDSKKTRVLVGLMVDAFPNARPHDPVTYTETLVSELLSSGYSGKEQRTLEPYPPMLVAMACSETIRTATFLPTIHEVLEKAESARKQIADRSYLTQRTLDAVWFFEDTIAALERLTDLPAEEPPIEARPYTGAEIRW